MHGIIARLGRVVRLSLDSLDLLLTLRPGLAGERTHKMFSIPGHLGGPATKHRQLRAACAGRGEPYSTVVCLSSVNVPLSVLRLLRWMGARVVVNQNGVYYPLWCPGDFQKRNRFLRVLNGLADHTFFQSEFALRSFERWVGPAPSSRSVLYNGVDRERFAPHWERKTDSSRIRVLLFHDFRGMNAELWSYFLRLAPALPDCEWVVMGQVSDRGLVDLVKRELTAAPVEWHLDPTEAEVSRVLASSDIAFHFVHNDVCPNKVLECLASGVFVLCSSAGGSRELVARGGGEMLPVSDGYEERSYPDVSQVLRSLEKFRSRAEENRREARASSERFDLSRWIKIMTSRSEG